MTNDKQLTTRQRKFVAGVAEGKSQQQAASEAGYRHPGVAGCRLMQRQHVREALHEALFDQGLDDTFIAQKFVELLNATDVDRKGNTAPNWISRCRAMDMLLKIRGAYKAPEASQSLTLEQVLFKIAAEDGCEINFGDA